MGRGGSRTEQDSGGVVSAPFNNETGSSQPRQPTNIEEPIPIHHPAKQEQPAYLATNQAFRSYTGQAGVEQDRQHDHVLRHSIAVHLMNAGWSAEDVQDWLGHKCISSTMVYGKVSNQRREKNYEDTVDSDEIARTTFN